MTLPSDREQARAARQAALDKLEQDVQRGHLVDTVTNSLRGIHERNHLAEMLVAAMKGKT